MREIWSIILDVSTILGGLAAVVFLYDRFGPIKAQASKANRHSSASKGLYSSPIAFGVTAHCLVSALIYSWISYRFGWDSLFKFALLGSLPSWVLSDLFRRNSNYRLEVVFRFGALFIATGGIFACLVGKILYYTNTGDANLLAYAGSSSSVTAGIFCILEAIVFSYLISR